jgi:hypothetical protein
MSRRVSAVAAAVAAAAAAVAGCASVVHGTPQDVGALSQPHFPTSSSTEASSTEASSAQPSPVQSSPTVNPTAFPSTSAQPPTSSAAPSTGSSGILPVIGNVHFTRPAGFVKRTNLQINHPISRKYQVEFLIPQGEPANGKDALAIALYDLPPGTSPRTLSAQKQFIERYNAAHQVSVTDGVREHAIAGYRGFNVLADEPPDYHYLGYYLFGSDTLVEVTCQYDKKLDAIATACGRIVGSMRVTS